jgi:superfamily II DNA or RNA helicase
MRGIAKVVTGGGKTVFAGMCINEFHSTGKGRVVVVVPTTALWDQWYSIMCTSWGIPSEQIATTREEAGSSEWTILLLVINTAREVIPNLNCQTESLLIVDECHRAASEINRRSLTGQWSATLGLSATPERQYDNFFETILEPKLGRIIIDYDYPQAFKDGVISGFRLTNHRVELTAEESKRYGDFSKKIMQEIGVLKAQGLTTSERLERLLMLRASVSKNAEMRLPVSVALIQSVMPRKTILFHESIDHIEAISIVLQDMGIDCRTYHSKLSKIRSRQSLSLFIDGSIDVLLTCRALDEGFDLPDIEVGIVASMTKSPRQRIQRLGRILRKVEGKIAEIKTIHTFHEDGVLKEEADRLEGAESIRWYG